MPELELSTLENVAPFESAKVCTRAPLLDVVYALRSISALDGLTDEEYLWLAEHGVERRGESGSVLFREDQPAVCMNIILTGEVYVRRHNGGAMAMIIGRAGQMTGKLPFSRMKNYGGDGYASAPIWALDIQESLFPEMLQAIPSMAQRCVTVLLDRVREVTRLQQQTEKLAALGQLAGNLAHELNNPASAAQRTAMTLRGELKRYGTEAYRLGALGMGDQLTAIFVDWVYRLDKAREEHPAPKAVKPLDAADQEEKLLQWLRAHQIPEPWLIAPTLAEAHVPLNYMEELATLLPAEYLPTAVAVFANSQRVEQQAATVLDSTERIFALIQAIKDYSYLDQAPMQDIDLRRSLESTLAMFAQRLQGITVTTEFDPALEIVSAYGSELNQVWTALIENAIEAIQDLPAGTGRLTITAHPTGRMVTVELSNNGPMIDPALTSRIFEPFFTTKAPGSGLGLGLDTAQRIVHRHAGAITVRSEPGLTCFQVRLPLDRAEAY